MSAWNNVTEVTWAWLEFEIDPRQIFAEFNLYVIYFVLNEYLDLLTLEDDA